MESRTPASLIMMMESPRRNSAGAWAWYSPVAPKTFFTNSTSSSAPCTMILGVTVCHPVGWKLEDAMIMSPELLGCQVLAVRIYRRDSTPYSAFLQRDYGDTRRSPRIPLSDRVSEPRSCSEECR